MREPTPGEVAGFSGSHTEVRSHIKVSLTPVTLAHPASHRGVPEREREREEERGRNTETGRLLTETASLPVHFSQ